MRDEIKIYQDGRYVSASKASHRLYGFDLHKEHPNVIRLVVHLKGRQTILFQEGIDVTAILNRNPHTILTTWFAFNKTAREHLNPSAPLRLALNTLYHDFPRIATWKKKEKQWALRTQTPGLLPVGRMYFMHPSKGERYFLRLLLHHMLGATSFEDLACTNRHLQHPTQHAFFKEACQQRGLLQDDAEWAQCMEEAASMASASCLRALFVALLVFNAVANPLALWERFKEDMAEDFLCRTSGWCSALPVYGSACQPALRLCMVMVCMLCSAQCSLCHVCALITCRASQRNNSMLPSRTWCCGSWRCIWLADTCGPACQCCGGR
jgi:hypothetical protein